MPGHCQLGPISHKIKPVASLDPIQHDASPKLRRSTNLFFQQFLKHPATISEFHSYAEFLYACLLEGDPTIHAFVPQPFQLWVGNRRYTPDVYVRHTNGSINIVELKPDKALSTSLKEPLTAFFSRHRMNFVVIDNNEVQAREQEALNWLRINQILVRFQNLDTSIQEVELEEIFFQCGQRQLQDFISRENRQAGMASEIALLRLLHNGILSADLGREPLNYTTELVYAHSLA